MALKSSKRVPLNDIPSRQRLSHIEDRISFSLFERLSSSNESATSLGLSFSLTPGEDALKEHEHVLTIGVGSPVQIGNLCITSSRLLLLAKSANPGQLRKWYDESQSSAGPHPTLQTGGSMNGKHGSFRRGSQKIMKRAESLVQWKSEENITRNEINRCLSPEIGALLDSKEPINEQSLPTPTANNRNHAVSPDGDSSSPSSPLLRPSHNTRKAFTILRKSKTQSAAVDYKSTFYCSIDVSKVPLHELPIKKPNSLKPSTIRSKNRTSKSFTTHDVTYSPVKTLDRIVSIQDNSHAIFRPLPLPPPQPRSESFCVTSQQFDKDEVQSLPELCDNTPYISSPPSLPESDASQSKQFLFDVTGGQQVSIPYGLISRLERIPRFTKIPLPSHLEGFRIVCKNCQTLTILFHPKVAHHLETVTTSIEFFLNFQSPRSVQEVALSYRTALRIPDTFSIGDHAGLYHLDKELSRLSLKKTGEWRVFELHPQNPALPFTYPPRLVVPLAYADADICKLAPLYRESRFPVLCWRHPGNRAALLRSGSIPRKRINRSQVDGDYMAAVCHNSSRQGDKLLLLCESSELIDANQQSATSQEKMQTFLYPGCILDCSFSPSPLPKLRSHLLRMQALLNSDTTGDYLTQLQGTRWMREVSKLLQAARFVAEKLEYDGMSVLVSFEAGYDYTTQVVSLAQLLLDPYYRTMDGFQVLIQKEWIGFGHRFQQRNLPLSDQSKDESPVFLQFIDCVWQIMQQFPSVFEFNEEFLHFIVLQSYSARFGDFLSNCVDEYLTLELDRRTLSLWTWLHYHNLESNRFYNSTYHLSRNKSSQQPIYTFVCLAPEFSLPVVRPWTSYYAKYHPGAHLEHGSSFGQLSRLRLLSSALEQLKQREHELKQKLDCYASVSSSGSEEDVQGSASRERQARALSFGLKNRGSLKRDCALSLQNRNENSTFFTYLPKDLISENQESKEMAISMYVSSGYLYRQSTSVIGTSKRFWAVCDLNKNYFALFLAPEAHSKQEVPKHIFKLSEIGKIQLTDGSNPSSLAFSFVSKGKLEKFHASSKSCSLIWYNCLSIRSVKL